VQQELFDDDVPEKKSSSKQTWSLLLARVFLVDVTVCPQCGGPMKITDAVTAQDNITKTLQKHPRAPRDGPLFTSLQS